MSSAQALRLALAAALAAAPAAWAQLPSGVASSYVGDAALSGVHGRTAVNMAAGDANVQANGAAVAIGGAAHATSVVLQSVDATRLAPAAAAFSVIEGSAFSGASGLVSVNQASGTGNAQANVLAIAIGPAPKALTESELSTVSTRGAPGREGATPANAAVIADGAFDGARGLVQVNQSAGTGNATANHFALIVQTGAKQP